MDVHIRGEVIPHKFWRWLVISMPYVAMANLFRETQTFAGKRKPQKPLYLHSTSSFLSSTQSMLCGYLGSYKQLIKLINIHSDHPTSHCGTHLSWISLLPSILGHNFLRAKFTRSTMNLAQPHLHKLMNIISRGLPPSWCWLSQHVTIGFEFINNHIAWQPLVNISNTFSS